MRVVKVKETGEETVSYTYDANGNKKSETLANGVVSTYTYNKNNRGTQALSTKKEIPQFQVRIFLLFRRF